MLGSLNKSQKLMAVGLLATLALTLWMATQSEDEGKADTVEVVAKPRSAQKLQQRLLATESLPIFNKQAQVADDESASVDLFKASQKQQKAMQQAAAAAAMENAEPAAPEAPPLPFSYLGKLDENGQTVIFLARDQRLYTVHIGDQLDSQYRLDALNNMQLEFTYLPLNTKQTLSMTGAS